MADEPARSKSLLAAAANLAKAVGRRVSLKRIAPSVDSGDVVQPLQQERQAPVPMDRPGVARARGAGSRSCDQPSLRRRPSSDEFPSTVWISVEQARDSSAERAREALAELCSAYWQPVYAFIRRKGNDPDRAADLTQDFFTLLIEPGALADVDAAKGKFRSFLMAACSHVLSNRHVYERALKRGGGRSLISIDQLQAEERLRCEPFHEITPERIFLREWATILINRVMDQLRSEARVKGRSRLFDQIRPALLGRELAPSYAQLAKELGVGEAKIKVAVHRLRVRFKELLRKEIARAGTDPAEIDQEISSLIQALSD
jgi:RNA polymerase sigma-70 factor (ECF subfamily)